MNIFVDSSALGKRYVEEAGSERVERVLASASGVAVSAICQTEVISMLCRLRRERKLDGGRYARLKQALSMDLEGASVVQLTDEVLARATEVMERFPLRSSDSLHVAAAIVWSSDRFVSADRRQCAAAEGCRLAVEWVMPER